MQQQKRVAELAGVVRLVRLWRALDVSRAHWEGNLDPVVPQRPADVVFEACLRKKCREWTIGGNIVGFGFGQQPEGIEKENVDTGMMVDDCRVEPSLEEQIETERVGTVGRDDAAVRLECGKKNWKDHWAEVVENESQNKNW